MVTWEEWMKKDYLKTIWNGVRLEKKKKGKILKCVNSETNNRNEIERELRAWNGSTWKNGE